MTKLAALIALKNAEKKEQTSSQGKAAQQPSISAPPISVNTNTATNKPQTTKPALPALATAIGFSSALKQLPSQEVARIAKAQFDPKLALRLLSDRKYSGVMKLPALVAKAEEQEKLEDPVTKMPVLDLSENLPSILDSLDQWQRAALLGLSKQQFACLIGAAGTGKTHTTKQLVKKLESVIPTIDLNTARNGVDYEVAEPDYNIAIAFCAFTGKAVQQLKRSLPIEYHPMCSTIHKLLGYAPEWIDYTSDDGMIKQKVIFKPTFTRYRKLPFKVIVMDESSMTPIKLWNELMEAMTDDCRVIMIGDINQLPPVQGRSVFGFAMTRWPVFELKEIWRQKIRKPDGTWETAEANPIVENAWSILLGKFPKKYPKQFDMLPLPSGSIQTFNTIIGFIKKLHEAGQFDPLKDALIVPQNKGNIGQVALNERLVAFFNPPKKVGNTVLNPRTAIITGMGSVVFGIGDKVMLLQNDNMRGLTNGMTGVIVEINTNGMYKGVNKYARSQMTEVEIDFEALENDIAKLDKQKLPDEKEEENASQRQASHVTVVRFGVIDPSKEVRLKELKADYKKYKDYTTECISKGLLDDITWDDRQFNYARRRERELKIEIDDLEEEIAQDAQEISFSTAGDYRKLTHAYAMTCHKSQGGEYPTVVIVCHSSNLRMLTREWLYTAVTRAKNRVILLCNDYGLEQALRTQRIKGSSTKEKVQSFVNLIESEARGVQVDIPNLPDAMTILSEEDFVDFNAGAVDEEMDQEIGG